MSWLSRWARSPEDRFADEMAKLTRNLLGVRVRRRDDFALDIGDDEAPRTMFLHNVYQEAGRLEGEERARLLRTSVLALAAPIRPTSWDEAAPLLLPAVRAVGWAAAPAGIGAHPLVRRGLVPFVSLVCAVDSEHAMSFVTEPDLPLWGVAEAEVFDRALANLGEQQLEVGLADGLADVMGPDGYASSWLALPQALAQVAADVGGTVVAVAPSRDSLVLVDADRHELVVDVLTQALAEYEDATRRLSPLPYLVDGDGLRPWRPPAGHPAAAVVDRADHVLAAVEYGDQRRALEDLFERAGEDVFVGPCTTMLGPGEQLWSWTTWARQVDAGLLPRADYVMFGDLDDESATVCVRWDDVVRLAGAAWEATGYDPPLWRYDGWPDEAVMAALRAVATEPPRVD